MTMHSCPKCDELAERVAWLESELRQQVGDTERDRLRAWMRNRAGRHGAHSMAIVTALYGAKGRVMREAAIMETMPPVNGGDDNRGSPMVKTYICNARKVFGAGAIITAWGKGYRLSPDGMELVRSIMEGTTA